MSKTHTLRILAVALCTLGAAAAQAKVYSQCSVTGPGGANVITHTVGAPANSISSLALTVTNGTARTLPATIQFAADVGTPLDSEVRLTFSLDGAAPQYYGPQNLANNAQYWEARSTLARIMVPPGTHTITPVWWVQAGATVTAVMDDRCMFVTL
jgi:hypothetical protein